MFRIMRAPSLLLAIALAGAVAAAPARAALGEPATSIAADQAALAATQRHVIARGTHRVERLASEPRTVRQYVSPDGIVFAVCWDGVTHPDLANVLGAYAAPVRRAIDQQGAPPRGRVRHVASAGAVLQTWGHMRDVHGCAWAPALVPAGVTVDEIR